MTETAPPPAQPLEYGRPAAPSFWKRHRAALLIAPVLLLVVAGYLVAHGRTVKLTFEQKWRLYEDRRRYYETAAETVPANHVVFDAPLDRPLSQAAVDPPLRWELLWSRRRYTSAATRDPVVFQHVMTTASGMGVLVAVQFDARGTNNQRQLIATMLKPGTLSEHPLPYGPFVIFDDDATLDKPLRLFAGQVDPADDHHFTIRYQNARGSGVLDGRMVDEPGATRYKSFGTIHMTRIPDQTPTPYSEPPGAP